jgi:hypothetical protein
MPSPALLANCGISLKAICRSGKYPRLSRLSVSRALLGGLARDSAPTKFYFPLLNLYVIKRQTVFLSEEQIRKSPSIKSEAGVPHMEQDWEQAYRAAVLETDTSKLAGKINQAITVLRQCLQNSTSPQKQSSERERMEDALRTLDMICRIELHIRG